MIPAHFDSIIFLSKMERISNYINPQENRDVYVLDFGNNRIQKFTSTGTFITKWGSPGSSDGQFNRASGLAVGASDYVYVTDTGNNRIQVFGTPVPVLVTFPDANLEVAIRQAINKPTGDIYQSDLLALTDFTANFKGIHNLSGLEFCTNLQSLRLDNNQISDISALSTLTNLQFLTLWQNHLIDISPLLHLTSMKWLYINNNQIGNISTLSNLVNLQGLYINSNEITDISVVAAMPGLQQLDIHVDHVNDISVLANLHDLQYLEAGVNQITDISALSGLTNLHGLYLYNNRISDISALSNLNFLQRLALYNNQITDISALARNQGLGSGDNIDVSINYLNTMPGSQTMADIQTLIGRGANLTYTPQNVHTLTVAVNGQGNTTPAVGTYVYPAGTPVSLTAAAATGWQFTNWTGGVGNANSANTTATMDADKTVTANFVPTFTLTIATTGGGSVTMNPNHANYAAGTTVTLTPAPASGWAFKSWTGDATGSVNSLTVTMNSSKNITANFIPSGTTLINTIKQNPTLYDGMPVKVIGIYRGWLSGYGSPPVTRNDWVVADGSIGIYVTGSTVGFVFPRDNGKSITVSGTVRLKGGVPYIEIPR